MEEMMAAVEATARAGMVGGSVVGALSAMVAAGTEMVVVVANVVGWKATRGSTRSSPRSAQR